MASRIKNELHTYVDGISLLIIVSSVHYDPFHSPHGIFAHSLDLYFDVRIYEKTTRVRLIVTPDGLQPLTQTVSQAFHDMINRVIGWSFSSLNLKVQQSSIPIPCLNTEVLSKPLV